MQTNMPRFQLAHLGSVISALVWRSLYYEYVSGDLRLFLLQSAHVLFPSNFKRFLMVCVFCAARSAAGFGGLRDIFSRGMCNKVKCNKVK